MQDPLERLAAHVAAQHWAHPWQAIRNAQPIPPRGRQHDCNIRVRAYLVWADDVPQYVQTIAYAWALGPRQVLVQVDDRRHRTNGAWLGPWDVAPADGVGGLWTTPWGTVLDAPPWAG